MQSPMSASFPNLFALPRPTTERLFAAAAATLALLASTAAPARSQTPIVSPSDRETLEGSSFTHYPIGRKNARVQTLHDQVAGGTLIVGHAYRRDAIGVRGVVQGLQCEMQVTLSMAPHAAASASSTFANNTGSSAQVVLPRQVVTFPATDRPSIDPAAAFELFVPYATPFVVPAGGGTLCVDVEVFSNQTPNGPDTNFSVYLDAHAQFADGRAVQPGFRTGTGCPAPGNSADCYANIDFWRMANGTSEFEVSIRNGVADDGSGSTRAWMTLGNSQSFGLWPSRSDCTFASSAETWFALPGTMTSNGRYDGVLANLPLLPPGFRLWCQAGSIDLSNGAMMSFGDASTLVTPPAGSVPMGAARIANGSSQAATSGTVSYSVPVMAFY
ncbi:MAG: hypothetical protein AB8H80_22235 [Planctomycetota bacterium]